MKLKHFWILAVWISMASVFPLFANGAKAAEEKKEEEAAFIKTMKGFIEAEGLSDEIQLSYVCQSGQEVCGKVAGNLDEVLKKRPDFLPDTYKFQRAHSGSTCSYRGQSGSSSDYSLHIVCYGAGVAGVHVDVMLPRGLWGTFVHDIRDVAENYFKIYVLGLKNSHTSEMQLARNFNQWWMSYKAAYPEFAPAEIPTEAAELLNDPIHNTQASSLPAGASGFR